MPDYHGVFVHEIPTSIVAPVRSLSALPIVVGTAPTHRTADPAAVLNKPVVVFSYQEAVQKLGYSDDWDNYTLCESMFTQFRQYGVAPVVFINVFDPTKGTKLIESAEFVLRNGMASIDNINVVPSSLRVVYQQAEMQPEVDYTVALSTAGVTVTALPTGSMFNAPSVNIEFDEVDPTQITATDIAGGIDPATGKRSGIEAIDDVHPSLSLVGASYLAPKWDADAIVRNLLLAKARRTNGLFRAQAIIDIPESAGTSYTAMPAWKETNGLISEHCIPTFGRPTLGDKTFRMSTHIAALLGRVDSQNGNTPFASPSNNRMEMDGMTWNGDDVLLDREQASFLGANGIITALNFDGWKAWGNRTGIYPSSTDPKDMWIPVRRMFNWFANEIVRTYWQKISLPIRPVLIDNICTMLNNRLAGLTSAGAILGGRVEWDADRNPTTDLIDGIIRFHVRLTPPVPAETIEFWLEYDPSYLETLATSLT
jgi:phage tail sheath protein FI